MIRNGIEPMIIAVMRASDDIALTLSAIFLRWRSTSERPAERLGEVAARLLLQIEDDGEELHVGGRHAPAAPLERLLQGHAELLALDQQLELVAHRLGRFARDDVEAFADRQARPDAAHDHVDARRRNAG